MPEKENLYLELANEKHYKFYEMSFSDLSIIISFGRIGSIGRVKIKKFCNYHELMKFYLKQRQTKQKKGYEISVKGFRLPKLKNYHPNQLSFW